MCLMLYLGSDQALPARVSQSLRIEPVEHARLAVTRWFSTTSVRFIGAHTGCSCGFPSVIADPPLEYYDGMPFQSDDRAADLRSVAELIALLRDLVRPGAHVQLYPIADGDEHRAPKGVIDWPLDRLDQERFFFNEGYMHTVRPGSG